VLASSPTEWSTPDRRREVSRRGMFFFDFPLYRACRASTNDCMSVKNLSLRGIIQFSFRYSVDHRSGLQLPRDERLDHLLRPVGLWSGVGDPLVLGAFEDLELDVAAGCLV